MLRIAANRHRQLKLRRSLRLVPIRCDLLRSLRVAPTRAESFGLARFAQVAPTRFDSLRLTPTLSPCPQRATEHKLNAGETFTERFDEHNLDLQLGRDDDEGTVLIVNGTVWNELPPAEEEVPERQLVMHHIRRDFVIGAAVM